MNGYEIIGTIGIIGIVIGYIVVLSYQNRNLFDKK